MLYKNHRIVLQFALFLIFIIIIPSTARASLDYRQVTLWAAYNGTIKFCEQSNGPIITESQAPTPGNNPWQWIVSDITGFSGNPNFSFTVLNSDGTQARLNWDPMESDWLTPGGLEGKFTLTLRNGQEPDIVYYVSTNPFEVSLRYIDVANFTVFENQTGGGDALPEADVGTYIFGVAPGSFSGIASDLDLAFSNRGAIFINDPGSVSWDEDGTFTLRINHGARPYSDLELLPLHLRQLVGINYTIFENQTGGGDAILATDVSTYGFAIAPGTMTGISSDLGLAFTNRGAISVTDPGSVSWDEDGTFTMRITPSSGPYCDIADLNMSLRRLTSSDFTIFENQAGGGDAIPPIDVSTYGFAIAPGTLTGISSDLGLAFTNRGAISVTDPGSVSWDEDGTFTMRITPTSGAYCDVAGLNMSLRRLTGSDFTVFEGQTGGGDAIPASDVGTYGFAIAPGTLIGISSDLGLAFTNRGAISVTDPGSVSWDEDGTFTMRITPSSGPYCDVAALNVLLRRLSPSPLLIINNGQAGNVMIQVSGDLGPWDWTAYNDGLSLSELSGSDTYNSSFLNISWEAGALVNDETGNGDIILQISDQSSPFSIVLIPTVIESVGCCDTPGDANNDGTCNIGDEVFLGNFVFRSVQCDNPPGNPIGCPPECTAESDANADGAVNIGDEVFLGNYIFRPPPASPYPECGPEK